MPSERSIESRLTRAARARGAICLKGENAPGFPDRVLLAAHDRVAFIETKAPGGRLSEAQKRWHRALRALGFRVEVLWSAEEVDAFVEEFLG